MRLWAAALIMVASMLAVERKANACAGCSNPNLPTARAGIALLRPGELSIALNLTGTSTRVVHSEYCPEIGPICGQRAEPPQLHDQRFYIAELRPVVAFGITDQLAVEAHLPVRVVDTTIRFRRLDRTLFAPDYENIHHRNETLFGVADPWLFGRVTGMFGRLGVTTRAGVGLPVGSTEEDPFARGRAGLSHQHIQFGTGTFYPVFSLDVGTSVGRARMGGYGQALIFAYENGYGYKAGNRCSGGLAADIELVQTLRIGLGADVLNEQPERWGGVIQQDGNVGRTDILGGGMISYALGSILMSATVRVPLWQHFIEASRDHGGDPGQLTYPAIVNLAVATSFGGRASPPKSGVLPP